MIKDNVEKIQILTERGRHTHKKFFLVFTFMLFSVFLVGSVSAVEWDNKLTYSNNDLKVELTNWFGFGVDYGTAELKSHKSVDEIRQVLIGDPVVMWYDSDFKDLYENGLGEIEIKDMKTGKFISKNWSYVYWGNESYEVPTYSKVISENGTSSFKINGSEIKYKEKWLDYNSRDIPKGKIRIGVKVNIGFEETLDIFWTIGGKKVTKHAVVTSGAVETTDGIFTVMTYLNNGTFNVSGLPLNISVLIVAGGGGGGSDAGTGNGGGGGAGGLIFNGSKLLAIGNFDVVVGRGGTAGTTVFGGNGVNSSFDNVIATGGGGGGYFSGNPGVDGGSGGGGGQNNAVGGTGIFGEGNDGGNSSGGDLRAGGGGGGAGAGGQNVTTIDVGGGGGNGLSFNINGTATFYAGGGGGGAASSGGVGGNGGNGGGGGGGGNLNDAQLGGNGIVIIRFINPVIIINYI